MDVKESARHTIIIQYIKVKYNSIPLITSENVFIAFIILYALVKLQMNYTFGFRNKSYFIVTPRKGKYIVTYRKVFFCKNTY